MMRILLYKLVVLLVIGFSVSSCYTVRASYAGNPHLRQLGQSKASIIANYGPPDRTSDDGSNGQVLIYEQVGQVSITNSSAASYSRYNTVGAAAYGNGAAVGASRTAGTQYATGSAYTQTTEVRAYKQFYVNPTNTVYFVRTNTGDEYTYSRCFDKGKSWTATGLSCLLVYPIIVTVPLTIIKQSQAKKRGEVCQ